MLLKNSYVFPAKIMTLKCYLVMIIFNSIMGTIIMKLKKTITLCY